MAEQSWISSAHGCSAQPDPIQSAAPTLSQSPFWTPIRGPFRAPIDTNTSIADAAGHGEEMREWLIQRLLKFKEVFGPRLRSGVDVADARDSGPSVP